MNVHEGSPVEDDHHGEQRKEQIENKLNVLRVLQVDDGQDVQDSANEEPSDVPFNVITVLGKSKVHALESRPNNFLVPINAHCRLSLQFECS